MLDQMSSGGSLPALLPRCSRPEPGCGPAAAPRAGCAAPGGGGGGGPPALTHGPSTGSGQVSGMPALSFSSVRSYKRAAFLRRDWAGRADGSQHHVAEVSGGLSPGPPRGLSRRPCSDTPGTGHGRHPRGCRAHLALHLPAGSLPSPRPAPAASCAAERERLSSPLQSKSSRGSCSPPPPGRVKRRGRGCPKYRPSTPAGSAGT